VHVNIFEFLPQLKFAVLDLLADCKQSLFDLGLLVACDDADSR